MSPISTVSELYRDQTAIINLLIATNNNRLRRIYYYQQNLYIAFQYNRVGQVQVYLEDDGFSITYSFKGGQLCGREQYRFIGIDNQWTELTVVTSGVVNSMLTLKVLKSIGYQVTQPANRFIPEISNLQLEQIRKSLIKKMVVSVGLVYMVMVLVLLIVGAQLSSYILITIVATFIFFAAKQVGDKSWYQSTYIGELRNEKSNLRYIPWLFLGLVIISQLVLLLP